jgi:uncharacterized protein YdhG (YjbR/CyaY superfamily)
MKGAASTRKPRKKAAGTADVVARQRAYVAAQPPKARQALRAIRGIVRGLAPRAVEVFSYGIPGFRLDGKPLVWYAAWKEHLSLYPIGSALVRALEVEGYKTAKGTIQLPLSEPLPAALVKRLVKARIAQLAR